MLVDEVRINIKGGNGGDGFIHFYSDAWRPKGGPDGGDGGNGGNVYFEAVNDISKLSQFRHAKVYSAEDGVAGSQNKCSGRHGEDLTIYVPVGTLATYDNGTSTEFTELGQRALMAKGGTGGHGNTFYKSATNQTPRECQKGFKTPKKNLFLQLKLIAQVGLIGIPNAGKTSLLNELTTAGAKVANYAFTTLEPNLGVTRGGHIIADIPGLIEGASDGKGLGVKFLKHIERTSLLVHCVSAESQDPLKDYQTVRQELINYSSNLANKPEIVLLTKSDLLDPKQVKKYQNLIKAKLSVSIIDTESVKKLNDLISQNLD